MPSHREAIEKFKDAKIGVIGDIILDRYTFGDVDRISPEAAIPIVTKKSEMFTLGGAGNVANNPAALGAHTWFAGIVGEDAAGTVLRSLLEEKGIGTEAVLTSPSRQTTEKHRIVSGDVTNGHVRLELGGEVSYLRPGSFVRILPNTQHRFAGLQDSIIIEISTHHEEDDSYRIEESQKMDSAPAN